MWFLERKISYLSDGSGVDMLTRVFVVLQACPALAACLLAMMSPRATLPVSFFFALSD